MRAGLVLKSKKGDSINEEKIDKLFSLEKAIFCIIVIKITKYFF